MAIRVLFLVSHCSTFNPVDYLSRVLYLRLQFSVCIGENAISITFIRHISNNSVMTRILGWQLPYPRFDVVTNCCFILSKTILVQLTHTLFALPLKKVGLLAFQIFN